MLTARMTTRRNRPALGHWTYHTGKFRWLPERDVYMTDSSGFFFASRITFVSYGH